MDTIIVQAIKELRAGKLVCFPSETVYALAADATNSYAVEEIYRLKGRGKQSPLSVMVVDINMAKQCAMFSSSAEKLANVFWPGPLTLVLPLRTKSEIVLSPLINEETQTLGIRIPNHPIAQQILKAFNKPIVATSVNPTGQPSATSVEEVRYYFKDDVFIVPGEKSALGLASTVVDTTRTPYQILREGTISAQDIQDAL